MNETKRARDAKQDEFYTQLSEIEKELKHYQKHFKGKIVKCICVSFSTKITLIL